MDEIQSHAHEIIDAFKKATRFNKINYEITEKSGKPYLIIYLSNPSERYFRYLNNCLSQLQESNTFIERATIKKRGAVDSRLEIPETGLLRTLISENLTASKSSVDKGEFSSRYIETVDGSESQLSSLSNHIVYGRRGAGKSSLLLYLVNNLESEKKVYSWLPMQAYANRTDGLVIPDIIIEMLRSISHKGELESEIEENIKLLEGLEDLTQSKSSETTFNRALTKTRRILGSISKNQNGLFIFIDDIHVLKDMQPKVLSKIYSITRDNGVYLKISGVQSFSKIYEPTTREGLEPPHDIQIVNLDHNLTMPDKPFSHIKLILNSYAHFCALPNISYICGEGVLERLIWVAAGVPRDALNLFSKSISKAVVKGQQKVSITSINASASEMADDKLRDVEKDISGGFEEIKETLERAKTFCIRDKRKNAFLVELTTSNPTFKKIDELIALRFLHILHEGITPSEAGKRYKALMLDYGFYVGVRAARSVDLFQERPAALSVKQLRSLPIFPLNGSK